MNYKHSCVVDHAGYYKTLVLVLNEPDQDGEGKEKIQCYDLKDGESLVDTTAPSSFVKPRWIGSRWAEGATAEEITAWEAEHPAPTVPGPSAQEDADSLLIDHEYRLTLLELGVI